MNKISIQDIQSDPSVFLKRVEAGEPLLIVSNGRTLAEVKPTHVSHSLRPYGLAAGEFRVPDDFDSPLPDEVVQGFEGR